jgi:hypothetical protein
MKLLFGRCAKATARVENYEGFFRLYCVRSYDFELHENLEEILVFLLR